MMFLLLVTLCSMLLAAIMSLVAWRVAREERRRSDARVDGLAAEIFAVDSPVTVNVPPPASIRSVSEKCEHAPSGAREALLGRAPRRAEIGLRAEPPRLKAAAPFAQARRPIDNDLELRPAASAPAVGDLFAPPPVRSSSRLAVAVAVGLLVVGGAAMLGLVSSAASRRSATGAQRASAGNEAAAGASAAPLELVALGHERDGERLIVRGVVRYPPARSSDRLTAVVFLFDRDGGFLASGRASVEPPGRGEGGESIFVVTVPGAAEVGRYRVSFRTDDRIVPHVDRRAKG